MILRRTTFIVGAGASAAYGLPLGADLLAQAAALQPRDTVFEALVDQQPAARIHELNRFISAVRLYAGPSIDSFLENQPTYRQIGHEVIAGLMAVHLNQAAGQLPAALPGEDWLGFVIERMRRGTRDSPIQFGLLNQHVVFVTFNFDRVIEDRLAAAVRNIYGATESEIEQALLAIRVIHVHGVLPANPEVSRRWIERAAGQIRVIHDELARDVVKDAVDAISGAEVVCFLGFSYQAENLRTLQLPGSFRHGGRVFGTARGMSASDLGDLHRVVAGQAINGKRMIVSGPTDDASTCRGFLEAHDIVQAVAPRAPDEVEAANKAAAERA